MFGIKKKSEFDPKAQAIKDLLKHLDGVDAKHIRGEMEPEAVLEVEVPDQEGAEIEQPEPETEKPAMDDMSEEDLMELVEHYLKNRG